MRPRRYALLGSLLLALAGCSGGPAETAPRATVAPGTGPSAAAVPALVATTVRVPPGRDAGPFRDRRTLQAPPGWTVSVWARVEGARLLAWTPDRTLLVSRPRSGDVIELTPGAGDAAPAAHTLIGGLTQPHGLAFAGDTLYLGESDRIDRFRFAAGTLTDRTVVADGLPDAKSPELGGQYAHALKSVAVGRDGAVYFSIGSSGNVTPGDRTATPERASIMRIPPGGGRPQVYAHGVRNGTGLAIDPDGALWTAVNNRDNVEYPYDRDYDGDGRSDQGRVITDYVNDHPVEPLARLSPGRDLGWPYCNPEPDLQPGAKDSALSYTRRPFVRDRKNNPDGARLDCATLPPIEQGMGAHSAPLGLSFAADVPGGYGAGALVGIHGSWNRRPPRAPEVSFFAWRDGTLGPQQTILTGFQDPEGSRWGRPVAAVSGPDGALYVSDDLAGVIYRVTAA
jgi:glucose/arabinose dehydrogenase